MIFSPMIREIFAVTVALQIFVMVGIVPGYCAYIASQLEQDDSSFNLGPDSLILIASMSVVLRPLGTILNIVSIEKIGRRGSLQLSFGFLTIGWLIITLANCPAVLFTGEALIGICLGMLGSGNLYVSEISTDKYRAAFVASSGVFIAFGTTLAYSLMYFFSWRLVAACVTLYGSCVFLILRRIPETPYWYILKGRRKDAKAAFDWINRYSEVERDAQLDAIQASTNSTQTSFKYIWKTIRQKFICGRILLALLLLLAIRIAGHLVINYFALELFDDLQFPLMDSKSLTILFGFHCFFSNALAILVIGKIGHRTLMILSTVAMIVCTATILACRIIVTDESYVLYPYLSYISVGGIFVHILFLYCGVGETIWVIIPELFPTVVRGSALVILNFASGIISTASTYTFPATLDCSFEWLCVSFLASSVFILLIAALFLPETANIPLHQAGIRTPKT